MLRKSAKEKLKKIKQKNTKIRQKINMQKLFYWTEVLIGTLLGCLISGSIYKYFYYSNHVREFAKSVHPWYYGIIIATIVVSVIVFDLVLFLIHIRKKYNLKY